MTEHLSTTAPDDPRTPGAAGDDGEAVLAGSLGRYRIDGLIGEGGMGAVYRGYDPKLDRDVALKVIRHGRGTPIAEARFRREAKTMAALNHPNVVPVFDVDTEAHRTFIAMEYVPGTDVRVWLRGARRSDRDIRRVFEQAGRGLHAAHVAGLVHRDFKPANILLGNDGRVLVSDFGLARALDRNAESSSTGGALGSPVLLGDLTETGATMGTLGYMAPEVLRGEPGGPLADQYAFCVALFEALVGRRPSDSPASVSLPAWAHDVVQRGLEPDPSSRWPDMAALLDALHPKTGWRRRLAVGVALLVGTVATVVVADSGDDPQAVCERAASRLTEPLRQRAVRLRAAAAQGNALAERDWARAETTLRRYARAWADHRRALCGVVARDVTVDRQLRCLEGRAQRFEALVAALGARASAGTTASDAARNLPPIEACLEQNLARVPDGGVADPGQATRLRAMLVQADALRQTGQLDPALAQARAASQLAVDLGSVALQAEAENVLAATLDAGGERTQAREAYERAYFAAQEAGHAAAGFEAANELLSHATGSDLERAAEWSRHARTMLDRMEDGNEEAASQLARGRAALAIEHDDFDRAIELLDGVIAFRERTYGRDSAKLVDPLFARVVIDLELMELEQVDRRLARIHAIIVARTGEDHAMMAEWHRMSAYRAMADADHERATRAATKALEIAVAVHGRDHHLVAQPLDVAAFIAKAVGDHERALELYEWALSIARRRYGEHSPTAAYTLSARAETLALLGRNEEAVRSQHEALQNTLLADVGPRQAGRLHVNGALMFLGIGAEAEARAAAGKAVTLAKALPADDLLLPRARWVLGVAALLDHDYETARGEFEFVLEAWQDAAPNRVQGAYTKLLLARALWPDEAERGHAHELAAESLALLEGIGDAARAEAKEARTWLAEHPEPDPPP